MQLSTLHRSPWIFWSFLFLFGYAEAFINLFCLTFSFFCLTFCTLFYLSFCPFFSLLIPYPCSSYVLYRVVGLYIRDYWDVAYPITTALFNSGARPS